MNFLISLLVSRDILLRIEIFSKKSSLIHKSKQETVAM